MRCDCPNGLITMMLSLSFLLLKVLSIYLPNGLIRESLSLLLQGFDCVRSGQQTLAVTRSRTNWPQLWIVEIRVVCNILVEDWATMQRSLVNTKIPWARHVPIAHCHSAVNIQLSYKLYPMRIWSYIPHFNSAKHNRPMTKPIYEPHPH